MSRNFWSFTAVTSFCLISALLTHGEPAFALQPESPTETPTESVEPAPTGDRNIISEFTETTEEVRQQVDQSEDAQKVSAGILQPIYAMAEFMSFSWFHWIAFALMMSGVVSYALQLVLGKLVVLLRGGFSLAEILTDVQGLLISLLGLFFITQAATENSTFTSSAAAVLSATVAGGMVGFVFYLWAQSAEIQAVKGRRVEARE